ncbi:efflux RND transporter periplasmic adaptor subunit [Shewanella sp.]|uniref:efflux RND transporter periplasmic adaptor subunit n=1 Tax=Shewanella sp. TaxID=50422 RepID=UPI003A96BCDF
MSVFHLCKLAVSLLLTSALPYLLAFAPTALADTADEHVPTVLQLSAAQRQLADIQVGLPQRGFNPTLSANAVLNVDRDLSYTIVPQLDVRVLQRHISPGQLVSKGQPLLTLGGVAVAQAQATFINAASDWQRISAMSPTAVSDSERAQAQVAVEQARAILEALPMTAEQIAQLRDRPELIGRFQLLAPMAGTVQQDHSQLGQLQQAGELLLQLSDESSLWVEAELTPSQATRLAEATEILVRIDEQMANATVIGRTHQFNASTRTERLLARIDNRQTRWHPGQFAEVLLPQAGIDGVLLPDSALTRSADGDWQVFIDTPAGFVAQEVAVLQRQRGVNLVDGVQASQRVVLNGAFFLAAELAKSGFDIHNH